MSAESFLTNLINEICIEICFRSFQHHMKMNSICSHCSQKCSLFNEKGAGVDIYGHRIDCNDSPPVVECPCCKKSLAATRFAPHLEKCMGMGRQASRKRAGTSAAKSGGGGSNTNLNPNSIELINHSDIGEDLFEDLEKTSTPQFNASDSFSNSRQESATQRPKVSPSSATPAPSSKSKISTNTKSESKGAASKSASPTRTVTTTNKKVKISPVKVVVNNVKNSKSK